MRRWQIVLPLAAGALVFEPIVSDRLNAQTTDTELGALVDGILQVEYDLRGVQQQAYGQSYQVAQAEGVTGASDAPTSTDQARERLIERVDGLEYEVRALTGQVEELGNKINQLQQQFNQFKGTGTTDTPAPPAGAQGPGIPLSDNSAQGSGLAPGETTLGQVPADSVQGELTPQDQYNAALSLLRNQDYKNAEAAFKSFMAQNGESELAGPAMYWLGETYYVQNDFTNAAQTFLDALRKYPNNPKAADSMLKLGMSLAALANAESDAARKKLELQQACSAFRDLPKKYPNASQTILQRAKVEAQRAACK